MMKSQTRILVIEDDASEAMALARVLRIEGYDVVVAADVKQALERTREQIDLVVSDLCLGRRSGMEALTEWRRVSPRTPFILTTAFGTVDTAVAAMKSGATDFLPKPVDPEQLIKMIAGLLHRNRQPGLDEPAQGVEKILGRSPAVQHVREQCRRVAGTDCSILILGESGTGKELVAEAIHALSPRSSGPRITVNMTAIPETLVESELFGHVKGAYTNAIGKHMGRFQAAHQGTLFIDEIGDIPIGVQMKLLRVLETRRLIPLGGEEEVTLDTRVIAATSRDLHRMTVEGKFREDLYYRLNVVQLRLPPLRERREDIPEIAEFYLRRYDGAYGSAARSIRPDLMSFLQNYGWPGNVRQLKNGLESMLVLSQGTELTPDDLPADLRSAAGLDGATGRTEAGSDQKARYSAGIAFA
ncbi:MAG: sigma-54 dependent transcriptional regulator [Pirellulales bacterium]